MSFLLGTAAGLVLGGFYGLRHTPRSGKDNRKCIKDYVDGVKGQSKVVQDDFNKFNQALNQVKSEMDKVQGPISQEFQDIAHQYQLELEPRLGRIQTRANKLKETLDNLNVYES